MNIARGLFDMALTCTSNRQTGYWRDEDEERWYLGNSDGAWGYYRISEENQEYGGEYWERAFW